MQNSFDIMAKKIAEINKKKEINKNHIIFLKGYIESWDRCIKFESFNVEGAADILMNYYDIHGLELMSAEEQLINLTK